MASWVLYPQGRALPCWGEELVCRTSAHLPPCHGRQLESWGWVGAAPAPCTPRGVRPRRAEPKLPPLTLPVAPPPRSPGRPPPTACSGFECPDHTDLRELPGPGGTGGAVPTTPPSEALGQGASGPIGSATGPLWTPRGASMLFSVPSSRT